MPIKDKIYKSERKTSSNVVKRCVLVFFTVIILIVGGLFGVVTVINYGPSKSARNLFVLSALESSAGDFLATMFFSKEQLETIVKENSITKTEETTDTQLIDTSATNKDIDKIEVIDVTGSTYKGKMMIIHNPARLEVGISGKFGDDQKGKKVMDIIKDSGAVAGTNAGGFEDLAGIGNGGKPLGIVIKNSELKWGKLERTYEVIGFDKSNKLIVGNMTAQQALDRGIRDAVNFGPLLIVNGKPSDVSGTGGGLNPRTAIGQREDGAVLLLVIDGRQVNSLGANFQDLVDVMTEFGAVNAANLDGGTSSHMIYNGEIITSCSSLYGTRSMPTAIIVK